MNVNKILNFVYHTMFRHVFYTKSRPKRVVPAKEKKNERKLPL